MRVFSITLVMLISIVGIAQSKTRIGYVDMQRAILEADDGQAAKNQLQKMKTARQSELDAKQKALRELQKGYEAQKAFMKADIRQAKEAELGKSLQELKMTFATLQRELAAEEAKLTKPILERMGLILAAIGKRSGDILILEKNESRILWAPPKLDLTNELIRRYNAGEGKAKRKKKAKKAKGKKKKK
jgi:outer membrane protein